MAKLTIANSNAQHYALHYDNKTTIFCRFQKMFFEDPKNWNTPFYLQMFCTLSGRSLSWNTPVFNRFTSREHANFIGYHFFHTHVLPHHSKAQLLRYCGKRSFLGVAKSWKVTLGRVPWFGRHVENLRDVQFWLWPGLFKVKTCWIVAQFLVPKPVNFASLNDSCIISFSKFLEPWSWMPSGISSLGPKKLSRLSRKRPLKDFGLLLLLFDCFLFLILPLE